MKLFCDRLGIDCLIAVSEADPEHGVRYRHAWNLVKIGGSWLHLDATFDQFPEAIRDKNVRLL